MFFAEEAKLSYTRLVIRPSEDGQRLVVRGSLMNSSVAIARVDVSQLEDGPWLRVHTRFAWPGSQGEFTREFSLTPAVRHVYFGPDRQVVWQR